jgi:hypothetical protein
MRGIILVSKANVSLVRTQAAERILLQPAWWGSTLSSEIFSMKGNSCFEVDLIKLSAYVTQGNDM